VSFYVQIEALRIKGDTADHLIAATAQICRVDQRPACRVQFGNKDVVTACIGALESIQGRKVGRCRKSRDISIPVMIDCHSEANIVARAAQVRGIDQGSAGGVDFRRKRVAARGKRAVITPHKVSLESSGGRGQVARKRLSGNVRVTCRIDGSPIDAVEVAPAQVRRIDRRAASRVELCQEAVAAAGIRLERIVRREVRGAGEAVHVGVAARIHGYLGAADVENAAAKVRGINQRGAH